MLPLRILILEDEYPAAERLQRLVAQAAPGAQVLAVLDTVAGALAWLAAHPAPDLILSDMQLADGLSLDVFAQAVVRSPVIFTTAYDQYAIRAFQANSIAYLLKPVKLAELEMALVKLRAWGPGQPHPPASSPAGEGEPDVRLAGTDEGSLPLAVGSPSPAGEGAGGWGIAPGESLPPAALALERLLDALPQRPHKSRFLVRQGETLLPLPAAEAAWFQSRHDTTTLATHDGRRFVVDYTLEQLEALLDPALFFRLNRQVLTQLPAVRRLLPYLGGKLLVELSPTPAGGEVLVSKEKASAVKHWLEGS